MSESIQTEVVVIGSGPGGYTAAFRAADLGKQVLLIERYDNLGGVCLNVGCIPSKALLHAAKVVDEAAYMQQHGIHFGAPTFEIDKLRAWKDSVVKRLTGGLKMLAKQRKVTVLQGVATFTQSKQLQVQHGDQQTLVNFEHAIIAAGSRVVDLPFIPTDPRIIDSTGALTLAQTQGELLIIGGGIIGMEMATVYHALGAQVTVVELADMIIPGCDADIVRPLHKRVSKQYKAIWLGTKVTAVEAKDDGLWVTFAGANAPDKPQRFDQILVAVGRRPNGDRLALDKAGVHCDARGFIPVDKQQRTNVPHIYAIGDIAGNPMLAHKAIPEGRVAAEVIAGKKHFFEPKVIPSVAYTDPEIAWTGIQESEAKAQGLDYGTGVFPWAASGRSLSLGRDEGVTKLIFDRKTDRVIGAGIAGPNAGDLIAEVGLAIEMGCDAEDIALTVHPHPTLSETVAAATEMFTGTITDLYAPKKKDGGTHG